MKKRLSLLILLLSSLLFLSGCMTGGSFDLGKFFGNPIVILLIIGLIIWFYFKRDNK